MKGLKYYRFQLLEPPRPYRIRENGDVTVQNMRYNGQYHSS